MNQLPSTTLLCNHVTGHKLKVKSTHKILCCSDLTLKKSAKRLVEGVGPCNFMGLFLHTIQVYFITIYSFPTFGFAWGPKFRVWGPRVHQNSAIYEIWCSNHISGAVCDRWIKNRWGNQEIWYKVAYDQYSTCYCNFSQSIFWKIHRKVFFQKILKVSALNILVM